jgi:putative oxidoreductase
MSKVTIGLWVLQGFLALFFAGASGAPKLFMPIEALPMPVSLSQEFVWFIGICEVLGGIGLLVPRLTRLAASCLVALTICATAAQLMGGNPGNAAFAAVMGVLCAVVAYGRWRVAPFGPAERSYSAAT